MAYGPTTKKPTKKAPAGAKRGQVNTYTDVDLANVVFEPDVHFKGTCRLNNVSFSGRILLDGCTMTGSNWWQDGKYALQPTAADPEMQGYEHNIKALYVRDGAQVNLDHCIFRNNDDVVQIGNGSSFTLTNSHVEMLDPYVGSHRDLIDCDEAGTVRIEDCYLHHRAHCLFWAKSEDSNTKWHVDSVEFVRCRFIHEKWSQGDSDRPFRLIHIDPKKVDSTYFEDCFFDARPKRSIESIGGDASNFIFKGKNVYWNTYHDKEDHVMGQPVKLKLK